jgi:FMN phosphatase YigB (HAD superfamily)
MLNDQLKTLIDGVEVVSFDIFDTLLLRRHYSPTDVFAHAAETRPSRFRFMRIAAERFARLRHRQQQDVSLEQIYATLGQTPERELLAEKQTLMPNPAARGVYDHAVAGGKRIIAVSDMYLPLQFLRERVENAGYTKVERVFVSCEAGVTKWRGDLFRHVAREMGVAPDDILHIGDNAHSDVVRAKEQGLRTWHLPSPRERFESTGSVHPQIVRFLRRGRQPIHSLLLGIMRDGLAEPSPERDYWYRLGFSVAGPVVNAFVDWIHDRGVYPDDGDDPLSKQVLAIRYPDVSPHSAISPHSIREKELVRDYVSSIGLSTDGAEIMALLFSAPSHAGALDFTRSLLEHEAAGYSMKISRDDVIRFIRSIIVEPRTEDVRHLGLPNATGRGATRALSARLVRTGSRTFHFIRERLTRLLRK